MQKATYTIFFKYAYQISPIWFDTLCFGLFSVLLFFIGGNLSQISPDLIRYLVLLIHFQPYISCQVSRFYVKTVGDIRAHNDYSIVRIPPSQQRLVIYKHCFGFSQVCITLSGTLLCVVMLQTHEMAGLNWHKKCQKKKYTKSTC